MCCRCRVQKSSVIDFFTGKYYWKRKKKKKQNKTSSVALCDRRVFSSRLERAVVGIDKIWIGPDRITDRITNWITDRIKDWITDRIMLVENRNFAWQAKIVASQKSAWHDEAQAPLEFFFSPKPHHFHGYIEECCEVPPWTKASEMYVSFHS